MSIGFIKLHRKLTQWEWYSDINTTRLFTHLLIMSNYEPKKWRGIQINRGEYLTGRIKLSEETGLSQQQIRTSLSKLKSTNEITIKATNKYTIIKLENYCVYQGKETVEQPTKQPTNNQTSNQQVTTTKEGKEIKEDKKEKGVKIPTFIDAELWNEYLKMRSAKKAKPTEKAIELVIKKLIKFENKKIDAANEALENSIESNYTGVFEPKTNFKTEKSRLAWKN